VKKVGALKIVHEKFRQKRTALEKEEFRHTFDTAVAFAPEIKPHLSKAHEDLDPIRVRQLFEAVTSEVCGVL
jgi:DNA-directed RNA polymerase III subunit RPC1